MTVVGFLNGDLTTLDIAAEDVVMQDATADSILFTPVLTPAQSALSAHSAGTFNATVAGSAVAGTPTYNTDGSAARYERIGNRVYISVLQSWSALAGAAGNLIFLGLPYPAAAPGGSEVNLFWVLENNWGSVTSALASGAGNLPIARIAQGSSSIEFVTYAVATGANTPFAVIAAGSITVNGFYEV